MEATEPVLGQGQTHSSLSSPTGRSLLSLTLYLTGATVRCSTTRPKNRRGCYERPPLFSLPILLSFSSPLAPFLSLSLSLSLVFLLLTATSSEASFALPFSFSFLVVLLLRPHTSLHPRSLLSSLFERPQTRLPPLSGSRSRKKKGKRAHTRLGRRRPPKRERE